MSRAAARRKDPARAESEDALRPAPTAPVSFEAKPVGGLAAIRIETPDGALAWLADADFVHLMIRALADVRRELMGG